ncbi:MAG: CocE/NonD family hydrolase, partial [Promethearchaeota archaeon]
GYWSSLGRGLDQTRGGALKAFKPINPLLAILGPLLVKGVKPVDPRNRKLTLKEAARIHQSNSYPIDYKERIVYRDDPINDDGILIDDISIFRYKKEIEAFGIPIYAFGSWGDSVTANVVISRFLNFDNPQKAIIGDWDHKALHRANPFHGHKEPNAVNRVDQIKDWLLFYEDVLSDKFEKKKILYYFTMGEEKWKRTEVWPPENQVETWWYFSEGSKLQGGQSPSTEAGADVYQVDFDATTGKRNRWYTLLSLPVDYGNRAKADKHLLTYTSNPLEEDLEITGHPFASIYLKTNREDGIIIVYLEFIDDGGKVHLITEGVLRFMHRKFSNEEPPYQFPLPYRSYKRGDSLPCKPGEVMRLEFPLIPTSILLRKGFRIRVAVAGADRDTFSRYPESGDATITVERNKHYPSGIMLPKIRRTIDSNS